MQRHQHIPNACSNLFEAIQADGGVRVAAAASKPQPPRVVDRSGMSTGHVCTLVSQTVHSCISALLECPCGINRLPKLCRALLYRILIDRV